MIFFKKCSPKCELVLSCAGFSSFQIYKLDIIKIMFLEVVVERKKKSQIRLRSWQVQSGKF